MIRAQRVGVALVAAALLVTTACSSEAPKPPAPKPTSAFSSYVALGDSSVAGPDITPNDGGSGKCARSKMNWPNLLAKALKIPSVRDVSCSGAVSEDILKARPAATARAEAAQIDDLSADTDLVTISIGGNDEGLFSKIILSCLYGPYNATVCESFMNTKVAGIAARTTDRVALTLVRIRKSAPNARIVVVGYLQILPAKGGCDMPGLSSERVLQAGKGMDAMNGALQAAAKRAKVEYVSMADASTGHEACSGADAWVNGMESVPGDGALLHPNSSGMHAVARTLVDHLAE